MSKNTKKCFFISPIGDADSDVRKCSDKIMRHILNPICNDKGYEVIRADKINSANKISADIVNHLENDELAIADLTGHNPNVFYELGYRKAKNMPIIHIAETGTTLPFDTIDDRTMFYDLTDLDEVEEFKQRLVEVIDSLQSVKTSKTIEIKEITSESLKKGNERTELIFKVFEFKNSHSKEINQFSISITWNELLGKMGNILISKSNHTYLKRMFVEFGEKYYTEFINNKKPISSEQYIVIDEHSFGNVITNFAMLGYIEMQDSIQNDIFDRNESFYVLSELGKKALFQIKNSKSNVV